MSSLFPIIQPQEVSERTETLPLCREIKWDFTENAPVFRRGQPEETEGADAVLVWAWLALHTPRFRHEIFSWSYGNELESLIGQPYTGELKRAEAIRYVRETLLINPYIRSVDDITVVFADGTLSITCNIDTIYGKREMRSHV